MGVFDGIRILQINLHHCRLANKELERSVNRFGSNVILCQDPYIFGGKMVGVPPFWRVFISTNYTSAVIITNPDYFVVESLKLSNVVFVNVNIEDRVISIGSQYSVPGPSEGLDNDFNDWITLFIDCSNIILGGDFNAPM